MALWKTNIHEATEEKTSGWQSVMFGDPELSFKNWIIWHAFWSAKECHRPLLCKRIQGQYIFRKGCRVEQKQAILFRHTETYDLDIISKWNYHGPLSLQQSLIRNCPLEYRIMTSINNVPCFNPLDAKMGCYTMNLVNKASNKNWWGKVTEVWMTSLSRFMKYPTERNKPQWATLLMEDMMDLYHVNLCTLELHFPDHHPLHCSWFAVFRRQSASWFRGQKYNSSDGWSEP